ncbi:uncharacterized protein TRIADDRAFT_57313 [Trichoplax adhaerens]|uniref:C2H2-type domain-containing protein n=1 Tax=Trichoplax adhaerens TaxID=10228 RepID=B3RZ36_TRIAD|nr:predicted protein [Trichoplax adhaerens]EDV23774.1 predicted protein [Trichoplax adhaerens]|eukprot:XP_002113300.1 predicted protein [Trichoplax adhaerens]
MALASANASTSANASDSNLPRFEACNPNLERTEKDVIAAKQLTSLRQGIEDKDHAILNDDLQIITQNSTMWSDYPQSHHPDEIETITKEIQGPRETANYNPQLLRRADSKKSRRERAPKFIQSAVDNFAPGEQFASYSARGPKPPFNFKHIDPTELHQSTTSASVGKDDLPQNNSKRENSNRTLTENSADVSAKKSTAMYPGDNKQILQNANQSVTGQDHVNGHSTRHRIKRPHDNQSDKTYDGKRAIRKSMESYRRDMKEAVDVKSSELGGITTDIKNRSTNRSTDKSSRSYSSTGKIDKQFDPVSEQATMSPSRVENLTSTGLSSSMAAPTSFGASTYSSSHVNIFTSVGGSAVTPSIPIMEHPSSCFRDETMRNVGIPHGASERAVVEVAAGYHAIPGPIYITGPSISSYSTGSAFPSTLTTSGVQAWPHAVDASMYYPIQFQRQHPVANMPQSSAESLSGSAILRRSVNSNTSTSVSKISTCTVLSSDTNSTSSSQVAIVTTSAGASLPDPTAIALSVVQSAVAPSQIENTGAIPNPSSWAPILPAPGRYSPSVLVNTQVVCPVCKRSFKSSRSLNGHMRLHGGFDKNRVQNDDDSRKRKAENSVRERDNSGTNYNTDKSNNEMKELDSVDVLAVRQLNTRPKSAATDTMAISSNISDADADHKRHKPKPRPAPLDFHSNINQIDNSGRSSRLRLRLDTSLSNSANSGSSTPPPYTPPPMLTPNRKSNYIFSPTLLHPNSSGGASQLRRRTSSSADSYDSESSDDDAERLVPKINVGESFQAEIPSYVGDTIDVTAEEDHADRIFICSDDLNREEEGEIENYLEFACSDGVPFGGRNKEFALHCLYKAQGNVKRALRMLLQMESWYKETDAFLTYHYTGSCCWSEKEKKAFYEAYREHQKDFVAINKAESEPSVPRRVRRTYQRRSVSVSPDTRKTAGAASSEKSKSDNSSGLFVCNIGGCTASFSSKQALNGHIRVHGGRLVAKLVQAKSSDSQPNKVRRPKFAHRREDNAQGNKKHKTGPKSQKVNKTQTNGNEPMSFICKVCGREFSKLKSRSAHMKTHKRADDDSKSKKSKD